MNVRKEKGGHKKRMRGWQKGKGKKMGGWMKWVDGKKEKKNERGKKDRLPVFDF